ncbi:YgaC family protein [Microbacterium elymi]|uniref:YgaC family protein n=1 Tax=Microbacterium elymi TaxID=2909587 RepID=A0ABY5NI14_9MICO|nr:MULTISPECIES: YgaC family protein [Microbacterium]UUT34828.1 YgaC family protein [Microbacterium elymi]
MSDADRPRPGTRLTFRWRKWDGSPHWEHDCLFLGSDDWGDWVGQPAGWRSHRPGREITAAGPNVTLIPPSGEYALTFNQAPPADYRVYIDLAWDVHWTGTEPGGIDMDLDVIRDVHGRIWIDDEDEWDEHRIAQGYPLDVVARLEQLATELKGRVEASAPPFDDATAAPWFDRLAALRR